MPGNGRQTTAARLHAHGEPLSVESVELPATGDGEVEVELSFAGVNPVDRYTAEGRVAPDGPLPRTLGGEAVGELDGRPVLVAGGGLGSMRDGLWAARAVVPRAAVLELPAGVRPKEAAAMGVAGLTAWNTVVNLAQVKETDRVLVLGASGGVGSVIVSLAASLKAKVWGQTGNRQKADFVRAQGAERVVVGGPQQVASECGDWQPTVVLDPLGGEFLPVIVEALAPEGRIVSFGTSAGPEVAFNLQTLYRKSGWILGYGGMQLSNTDRREGLQHALEALAGGRLRIPIDDTLPLAEVGEAFARLERREVQGNLLLYLRADR